MKVGVDLGGSHIGMGIIDDNGRILEKKEIELYNIQNMQEFIIDSISNEIDYYIKKYNDIEMIGIASPGTPKDGKLTNIVNLGIKELDISTILKFKFNIPVKVKNDAKCAAIAEMKYGALNSYQDAVFLCLGTGIGGAVLMGGKELEPIRNSGMELGHIVIEKNGIQCNCGKRGCFETYCSIKRLKNKLMETMNISKEIDGKELLNLLKRNNDEKVKDIINEYIDDLIVGLSNIIDIFEPQGICLGGGFVYFEDILYKPFLKKYYEEKYVFNKEELPEIKLALLGNDAGIIGATLI